MWHTKVKIYFKKLIAKNVIKSKEDHTPILFEPYVNDYYYIVNNNNNNVYSTDELYELLEKEIDPFTRLPLKKYKFVRVYVRG